MKQPRHILVVDDDRLNSSALERHLQRQGFRVTVAESCKQGREILSGKSAVDLIILDHLLPDGSGTDLLETISQDSQMQKPPVIMSSSLFTRNPTWEELIEKLPADTQALIQACVPKPYSLDNMHTVVDLIFDSTSPTPPNTFLSGDYRHPKK